MRAEKVVRALAESQPLYPVKGGLFSRDNSVMCTLCSQTGASDNFRHSDSCPYKLAHDWMKRRRHWR